MRLRYRVQRIAFKISSKILNKLFVFDFDDTLVSSESIVTINHNTGETTRIGSAAFAHYKSSVGDEIDFTDFNDVTNPRLIKKGIDKLRSAVHDKNNRVVILTARSNNCKTAVGKFLKEIGISGVDVFGLGSSDPMDKARWISANVTNDTKEVYFMDDSRANTKAVSTLGGKIGSKLKVEHVPHPKESDYDGKIINKRFTSDNSGPVIVKITKSKHDTSINKDNKDNKKTAPSTSSWWDSQTTDFKHQYCLEHSNSKYCKVASFLARSIIAAEFPNVDALNKYLQNHPGANRSNHKVVKTDQENDKVKNIKVIKPNSLNTPIKVNKPIKVNTPRRVGDPKKKPKKQKVKTHNIKMISKAVLVDGNWQTPDGDAVPNHIKSLVIPHTWKDVRFDPDPDCALAVQGYFAHNQLKSIYSLKHISDSSIKKFLRVSELIQQKDDIKKQIEGDLVKDDNKDNASCMRLIFMLGIRPGSKDDTVGKKKSYGASTLLGKHVKIKGDKVYLNFIGKSGVRYNKEVKDLNIANDIKRRSSKVGAEGKLFSTNYKDLLNYAHTLGDGSFTMKDYRTMIGTQLAKKEVLKMSKPKDLKSYKKKVKQVAVKVSKELNNTPVVALQKYIDPLIFSEWRNIEWGQMI